jgi:hypothetical protein
LKTMEESVELRSEVKKWVGEWSAHCPKISSKNYEALNLFHSAWSNSQSLWEYLDFSTVESIFPRTSGYFLYSCFPPNYRKLWDVKARKIWYWFYVLRTARGSICPPPLPKLPQPNHIPTHSPPPPPAVCTSSSLYITPHGL